MSADDGIPTSITPSEGGDATPLRALVARAEIHHGAVDLLDELDRVAVGIAQARAIATAAGSR